MTKKQQKKEHTFDIINELQNNVFSELNSKTKEQYGDIAKDNQSQDYKSTMSLLSHLDHFAYGVLKEFYDLDTVADLCGDYLCDLYNALEPVIARARNNTRKTKSFRHFEDLIIKIKEKKV